LQTDPCNYAIDIPVDAKPGFSRAIAVRFSNYGIIFVSGTGSIRASDVVFEKNIARQTETTIENIAYLVGEDNLMQRQGLPRGVSLHDIQQIRVYVKQPGDYPIVKRLCEEALGEFRRLYRLASICRPSLLLGIEAVAIVQH